MTFNHRQAIHNAATRHYHGFQRYPDDPILGYCVDNDTLGRFRLANALDDLLCRCHLPDTLLAEYLDVSLNDVGQWRMGLRRMPLEMIDKFVALMGRNEALTLLGLPLRAGSRRLVVTSTLDTIYVLAGPDLEGPALNKLYRAFAKFSWGEARLVLPPGWRVRRKLPLSARAVRERKAQRARVQEGGGSDG